MSFPFQYIRLSTTLALVFSLFLPSVAEAVRKGKLNSEEELLRIPPVHFQGKRNGPELLPSHLVPQVKWSIKSAVCPSGYKLSDWDPITQKIILIKQE